MIRKYEVPASCFLAGLILLILFSGEANGAPLNQELQLAQGIVTPTPQPTSTTYAPQPTYTPLPTPTPYREIIVIQTTPSSTSDDSTPYLVSLLTFVSNLVSAVAWPVVILLVTWFFRAPLRELIETLSRVKYGSFEASFERRLERVQREAREALSVTATETPDEAFRLENLMEIAEYTPRGAVLEAWLGIEQSLSRLGEQANLEPQRSLTRLASMLMRKEVISREVYVVIEDLRRLRNEAVHAPEFGVGPSAAQEYVAVAASVIDSLEGLLEAGSE